MLSRKKNLKVSYLKEKINYYYYIQTCVYNIFEKKVKVGKTSIKIA